MARTLNQVLKQVYDLSEEHDTETRELFGLSYAEFGVGKTTLIMRLAQRIRTPNTKILLIDSSDGWVALDENPELKENVKRFRANDPADIVVLAEALRTGKYPDKISVVVVDEVSTVFDMILEAYLREKNNLAPDDQLVEAEGRDYGPPTAALASMLNKLHQAPGVHVLLTAHSRMVGEGQAKELRPSLPPKAYLEVMRRAHFGVPIMAKRRKVAGQAEASYERTVQLKPSAVVAAKSRLPGSPVTCSDDDFIEFVTNWVDNGTASLVEEADDYEEEVEVDADEISEVADAEAEERADDDEETEEAGADEIAEFEAGLKAMKLPELRRYVEDELDIRVDNLTKFEIVAKTMETLRERAAGGDTDDEDEGSEVDADARAAELGAMTIGELRDLAAHYGLFEMTAKEIAAARTPKSTILAEIWDHEFPTEEEE